MRTLSGVLVRHRYLLSARLSIAAGIILKSIIPIPLADPIVHYAELQRQVLHQGFCLELMDLSIHDSISHLLRGFSLAYIHFYQEETAQSSGNCVSILSLAIVVSYFSFWANSTTSSNLPLPRTRDG